VQSIDIRSGKTSFADMAYRVILDAIMADELKPGDRVRPNELATTLRVSRYPIDRALDRLIGEGFVDLRPGEGTYIKELAAPTILELYDLRLMLEIQALEQGIIHVDAAFLADMERLLKEHYSACASADGSFEASRALVQADREVHLHLMSMWPNQTAQAWYRQANVQIKSFLLVRIAGSSIEARDVSIAEHQAIYQGIERQDIREASRAVKQHGSTARAVFLARAQEAGLL
jgi:DNA-binding GntR family transcriptional regulator